MPLPGDFRRFRRFRRSDERSPCFLWVECKFVIFAVFVKTAPFWQGTKARFTKKTVCATPAQVIWITNSPYSEKTTIKIGGVLPYALIPERSFKELLNDNAVPLPLKIGHAWETTLQTNTEKKRLAGHCPPQGRCLRKIRTPLRWAKSPIANR